jgi:hypothetical protein
MIDTKPNIVIGVMPADFNFFGNNTDFWVPEPIGRVQVQSKAGWLILVARLKKGVAVKQAQAEMAGITAQLASSDPVADYGSGAEVEKLGLNFRLSAGIRENNQISMIQ